MSSALQGLVWLLVSALEVRGQRLRITNGCSSEPVWIAHMASNGTGPDQQNVKLAPGETFAFRTPEGLSGTRYWPKMHCDSHGNGCLLGESGGPGESCDLDIGCAPPVDTKFEASFGANTTPDWVDVSLVDGWTLPFKMEMSERCSAGEGSRGVGTVVDCSHLSFSSCPQKEDLVAADNITVSLKVKHPSTGGTVGCYSPCAKLTFSNWQNEAAIYAPADPQAQEYCCPTPPESPGQCRAGPVGKTHFVEAVHSSCPGVYGYAYDDGMGLILCPSNTTYDVTFYCPEDLHTAFPKTTPAPSTLIPKPWRPGTIVPPTPVVPQPTLPEVCAGAAFAIAAVSPRISLWECFKLSHHQHLLQDNIVLRTYHGRYMAAEPDGFITATSGAPSYWEFFKMHEHSDGLLSFRSVNGKFLRTEAYGAVHAVSDSVSVQELFKKVDNDDGTISLQGYNGKFLSALRTCASDPAEPCFEKDTAYLPLDMPGTAMTREALPLLCQARCAATRGCDRFSFYPEGDLCHLQDRSAMRVLSLGSMAGPGHCRVIATVRKNLLASDENSLPGLRASGPSVLVFMALATSAMALAVAALAVVRRAQTWRFAPAALCEEAEPLEPLDRMERDALF